MKTSIKKQVATQEQKAKHRVKGNNFMTPDIIEFYFIPHSKGRAEMVVEISEGTGIDGDRIWGVTCSNNGDSYHELSKCLHSEDEVVEYVNKLK